MENLQTILLEDLRSFVDQLDDIVIFISEDLSVEYLNSAALSQLTIKEESSNIFSDIVSDNFPESSSIIFDKVVSYINRNSRKSESFKILEGEQVVKLLLKTFPNGDKLNRIYITIRKISPDFIISPNSSKFEGFLDLISSTSGDVIYQLDYSTGNYNYLSPGIFNLTGYTEEEINRIGFQKIIKKIERFATTDSLIFPNSNEISKSDWINNQYQILTKDNQKKWVDDRGKKIKNADGKIIGIFGVFRDITERRRVFSTLAETEKNYRSVLDLSPFSVAVLHENKIVYANKQLLKVLKYDKVESILGKSVLRFIPKEQITRVTEIYLKVLTEQVPMIHNEEVLVDRFRNSVKVRISSIPIYYDSKMSLLLVLEDITEQVKADRVKNVLNDISHFANTSSDINEFYQYIHSSIKKLMKVDNIFIALYDKKSEMLSFPYFVDCVDSDNLPIKSGKSLTDYVIRTKKSHLIDIEEDSRLRSIGEVDLIGAPSQIWLGVPLIIKDEIIGAIVLQDYDNKNTYSEEEQEILETISYTLGQVIENKLIEEEKKNLIEELKNSNYSKDKFFSIISHDLRGPFNAILGYSSLLKNEYETLSKTEVTQFIGALHQATYNVFKLLNDLLEYSRFQLGRIEYNPTKLNLKLIVVMNLQTLQGNFDKKQITTEVNIDESIELLADEQMLNSIIQNLLTNAVKFSHENSKIFLSAIKNSNNEFVSVEIRDQGVGMTEDELSKIFKLDSVFTKEGTSNESGTGFGLLLVKEFIEKHGGKITVNSEHGKGTSFTFNLPLYKQSITT